MTVQSNCKDLLKKIADLEKELTDIKKNIAKSYQGIFSRMGTPHENNLFEMIIDNAPLIIDAFDTRGNCVFWNKKGEELLGWTKKEVIKSDDPLALFYPDPTYRKKILQIILKADGKFRKFRLKAKNGDMRIQEWANFKFGENIHIAFGIDITEKQKTEKDLEQSHYFIKTLLQTIPNPVFHKNAQGRYTGCNTAYEEFMGIPERELMGKTVFETAPEHLAQKYHEHDTALLKKPGKNHFETQVTQMDGTLSDIIIDKASIINSKGEITGIVGIFTDITHRKQMERALKKKEARFRAFTQAIPDILFIFDEDGRYIEIFTSASELLFDELTVLKGNYIKNTLPTEVARQHMQVIEKTIQTQKSQFFEYALDVPKGRCWFESHTAPIMGLEEEKYFIASSVRDITDRKLAEKEINEKERLAAVMETAGAVCHELNQPLQIISGCCELLADVHGLDAKVQRKINIIMKESRRMAKLNHNLMNITSYKTKSYLKSKIIDIKGATEA
ncbi:PAS domain S-box-containing protein [Desulfocicer vacuolatum DSM 3385]|uniref:histidine kinase n=1 Tax=Desulfocicer vacuolatum DSM 3385 TaxID=1121400 RepID=A0A1W1YPM3_9BACT|nr:PAS domain S-box protein [Desulfocicer vacuolatum]SMC38160.1 PAS domain S-box-containing protein [Desulfocicer vacuolatum DSM 3385]